MKRTITLLSLIGCFTLAHAQGGHVFTEGAFRFSVSADVDTATGDSLATIIGFDRDRDGGQAMKEKVLEIPGDVSHRGVPYKVNAIGRNALAQCGGLEQVIVGEGIECIEPYAFYACPELRSVVLPASLNDMDGEAFSCCPRLTEIHVDQKNPTYDSRDNCNAVIDKKSKRLVAGCAGTAIPDGVESIADGAFSGCLTLDSIALPEGVTEVGAAFMHCANLRHIALPRSLKRIGNMAFYFCTRLASVSLPQGLEEIGNSAFAGCNALKAISIPKQVGHIGEGALHSCLSLESIVVDKGNRTYDSRNGCNGIVESATGRFIAGCRRSALPEGIKEVMPLALGHTPIDEIFIPKSVTRIHPQAFISCNSCVALAVDAQNPVYDSREDCNAIIETATGTLVAGCPNTRIPSGVTRIGAHAFSGIQLPPAFHLPEGVREIGEKAFSQSRTEVVTFPASLQRIGSFAFAGSAVHTIFWEGHVEEIPSYSFADCSSLRVVNLPEGTRSIKASAFAGCSQLERVGLPSSLEQIAPTAFEGCPCDSLVRQAVPPLYAKE